MKNIFKRWKEKKKWIKSMKFVHKMKQGNFKNVYTNGCVLAGRIK